MSRRAKLLGLVALVVVGLTGPTAGLLYWWSGTPTYVRPMLPVAPSAHAAVGAAAGPLRVHPQNPRYFTDGSGRAVLLTGAHTWSNLQDNGIGDPPPVFNYPAYLEFLGAHNLNFFRLWAWEQARWASWVKADNYYFYPGPPFKRTGPGAALDGRPRFDLDAFEPAYFERLRSRVAQAGERGIYVAVMLFNGWAIDNEHSKLRRGNPWRGHPFNRHNNVNGVDGDPNGNDGGEESHQLVVPRVTAYQEAYVQRVVDAVNDLDNVLFEISNESYASSKDWQYHMIDLVHRYERAKPKQHPVGMSQYQWPGSNADLRSGPADWIAPWEELPADPYRENPPVADGGKVVIVDTDHLWGIGGNRRWAWKSFLRGNQPSFMDGYDGASVGCGAPARWDVRLAGWEDVVKDVLGLAPRPAGWDPNAPEWVSLRTNMGYILDFSRRVKLAEMTPQPRLASTGYCLVRADVLSAEYLVYLPTPGKPVDVDLSGYRGELIQEWFDPVTGATAMGSVVRGGGSRHLASPFADDAVLYLRSIEGGRRVSAGSRR